MKCFLLINVIIRGSDYAVAYFELNKFVDFVSRTLFQIIRETM